jgi:hypothetical protein
VLIGRVETHLFQYDSMAHVLFNLDVIQNVMRPERHQKYYSDDGSNKQQTEDTV